MTTKTRKVTQKQAEATLATVAAWLGTKGMGTPKCPKGREVDDHLNHVDDGSECLFVTFGPAPTGQDAAYRGLGPELVMDRNDHPTVLLEGGPYDWAIDCTYEVQAVLDRKRVNVYVEPYAGYALSIFPRWWS